MVSGVPVKDGESEKRNEGKSECNDNVGRLM